MELYANALMASKPGEGELKRLGFVVTHRVVSPSLARFRASQPRNIKARKPILQGMGPRPNRNSESNSPWKKSGR